VQPQEAELVPIAALEGDLIVDDVEEAAASEAERIAPFEDRPIADLEEIIGNADHACAREFDVEHLFDRGAALDGALRHLVVDCILGVKPAEGFGIGAVEGIDPGFDDFFRRHRAFSQRVTDSRCSDLPSSLRGFAWRSRSNPESFSTLDCFVAFQAPRNDDEK